MMNFVGLRATSLALSRAVMELNKLQLVLIARLLSIAFSHWSRSFRFRK